MPRRCYGSDHCVVLAFQEKSWKQLSSKEQEAAKMLQLSEVLWNSALTPFHDDLWKIPDVTLGKQEFASVLATVRKMSHGPSFKKENLAAFLLGLEKCLLPSQAVSIADTLKSSPSWENWLHGSRSGLPRFNTNLIVAGFLSYPRRILDFPHEQLLVLWDDNNCGCIWGNSGWTEGNEQIDDDESDGRSDDEDSDLAEENNGRPSYSEALLRLVTHRKTHRMMEAVLTGSGPVSRSREGTILPALPKSVVRYILDKVLGAPADSIDPRKVAWLTDYGTSLGVLFARAEDSDE